jgi:hypothetical protein
MYYELIDLEDEICVVDDVFAASLEEATAYFSERWELGFGFEVRGLD